MASSPSRQPLLQTDSKKDSADFGTFLPPIDRRPSSALFRQTQDKRYLRRVSVISSSSKDGSEPRTLSSSENYKPKYIPNSGNTKRRISFGQAGRPGGDTRIQLRGSFPRPQATSGDYLADLGRRNSMKRASAAFNALGNASQSGHTEKSDKKCSLRSHVIALVGITLFRKMYASQLNAHSKKKIKEKEMTQKHCMRSKTETIKEEENFSEQESYEEDVNIKGMEVESVLDEDLDEADMSHLNFYNSLSKEAKAAYLACYDDKLRDQIQSTFSQQKERMCRRFSIPQVPQPAILQEGDNEQELYDHAVRPTGDRFIRATEIMDSIRAEKGENVTNHHYIPAQRHRMQRRQTHDVIHKYNTWTNSWLQRNDQA